MAVLAGLVAILVSVAATQRTATRSVQNRLEIRRARVAAEAGIQRALAELSVVAAAQPGQTGAQAAPTGNQTSAITLQDEWAQLGQEGDEEFVVGRGSFRVQVLDSASLLNLNTATQEQLERLPLSVEQVESLLDFREGGRDPRPTGGKDEYYNGLPEPYNAKLRRFDSFDELLLVKEFTPQVLYEAQTNVSSTGQQVPGRDGGTPILYDLATTYSYSAETNAQGQSKINVNAQATTVQRLLQAPVSLPPVLAQQIAARKNWPRIGDLLALPGAQGQQIQRTILDNLVVGGAPRTEGKVNLNTATESVLSSIPELTPDAVQSILSRQSQGFATLGDLVGTPGISTNVLQQTAHRFTVSSQSFLVRVVGKAGNARQALEAVVDIQQGRLKVVSITDMPFSNMEERWGWEEEPTTETVLKEES
jgi:general secretion pathway protein K